MWRGRGWCTIRCVDWGSGDAAIATRDMEAHRRSLGPSTTSLTGRSNAFSQTPKQAIPASRRRRRQTLTGTRTRKTRSPLLKLSPRQRSRGRAVVIIMNMRKRACRRMETGCRVYHVRGAPRWGCRVRMTMCAKSRDERTRTYIVHGGRVVIYNVDSARYKVMLTAQIRPGHARSAAKL